MKLKKKSIIVLLFVFVISSYIFLFNADKVILDYDTVYWIHKTNEILNGDLVFVGVNVLALPTPQEFKTLVHLGPFFFYILTIPLFFSKNPISIFIFSGILHMFSIFMLFIFCKKYFNENIALLSTLLYTINPIINFGTPRSWPIFFVASFSILFFFFLVDLKERKKNIVFLIVLLAIMLQLHLLTFIFFIILVLVILFYRIKIPFSYYLIGSLSFLILFSPYLYNELNNDFKDIRVYSTSFTNLISGKEIVPNLISENRFPSYYPLLFNFYIDKEINFLITFSDRIQMLNAGTLYYIFDYLSEFNNYNTLQIFLSISLILNLFFFLIGLFFLIFKSFKSKNNIKFVVLCLWIIMPIILIYLIIKPVETRYFSIILPATVIIISYFIDRLLKFFFKFKFLIYFIVFFLILGQIIFTVFSIQIMDSGELMLSKKPLFTLKDQKESFTFLIKTIDSYDTFPNLHNIRIKESIFPYASLYQNLAKEVVKGKEDEQFMIMESFKLRKYDLDYMSKYKFKDFDIIKFNNFVNYNNFKKIENKSRESVIIPYFNIFDLTPETLTFEGSFKNNKNSLLILETFHFGWPFNDNFLEVKINGKKVNITPDIYTMFYTPMETRIEIFLLLNKTDVYNNITINCFKCNGFDIFGLELK